MLRSYEGYIKGGKPVFENLPSNLEEGKKVILLVESAHAANAQAWLGH